MTSHQPALISYDIDGTLHDQTWPGESTSVLRQIRFYDDTCGKAYITHDTAVSYRPSTLVVLDRLIDLCDAVRGKLDLLLAENGESKVALPTVPEGTPVFTFLAGLSGGTKPNAIDAALAVPDDIDERITALVDEEARLRATDPYRERTRLTDLAHQIDGDKGSPLVAWRVTEQRHV